MPVDLFLIMRPKSGSPVFTSETLDAQFKSYQSMQLDNFQLGGANPTSIQGAGKISFNLLTFTKNASVNSPKFLQYCSLGIPLDRVTLYVRQVSGTAFNMIESYTMGTAYVMSYNHDNNNGDTNTETISINYSQFDHHYYPYSPTGVRQPAIFYGWSTQTNANWIATPLDGPLSS
jgi:type VI protein secretion system component Hcp